MLLDTIALPIKHREKWFGKFRQWFKRNFRAQGDALEALGNWSFFMLKK